MIESIAKAFVVVVALLVVGSAVIESSSTPAGPQNLSEVFDRFKPDEASLTAETDDQSETLDNGPSDTTSVTMGMCADYDVVAHPEQILDVLMLASSESCRVIDGQKVCTPVEILYAIWQKETAQVDGAGYGSGKCDVMAELAVRDGAANTHHAEGMRTMAQQFGWNLEGMTCSCPKIVDGERHGYGGCCGPFQFSAGEIAPIAIETNLDPLHFCGGAVLAAKDLLKRYDLATKKGFAQGYPAWRRAISSYYGSDPDSVYYTRALAKWEEFSDWQACEYRAGSDDAPSGWFRKSDDERCDEGALDRQWAYVRQQLAKKTNRSVEYFRDLRE